MWWTRSISQGLHTPAGSPKAGKSLLALRLAVNGACQGTTGLAN
ncbi:MAG: hypothetical protein V8S77_07695 [Oscillospiraceae bacterium]